MTFFVLVCPVCEKAFTKEVQIGSIYDKRAKHEACGTEKQVLDRQSKMRGENFTVIGESVDPLTASGAAMEYNLINNKGPDGFFEYKVKK